MVLKFWDWLWILNRLIGVGLATCILLLSHFLISILLCRVHDPLSWSSSHLCRLGHNGHDDLASSSPSSRLSLEFALGSKLNGCNKTWGLLLLQESYSVLSLYLTCHFYYFYCYFMSSSTSFHLLELNPITFLHWCINCSPLHIIKPSQTTLPLLSINRHHPYL